MAVATGSIPVAPTTAASMPVALLSGGPEYLVRLLFTLFARVRPHRLLRAANPRGRCPLQSCSDAAIGQGRRQGRHRPDDLPRARALVLRDRRPAAAGFAARRGRALDRPARRGLAQAQSGADRRRSAEDRTAGSTTPRSSCIAAPSSAWCPRPTCRTIASSTRNGISCRAPTCSRARSCWRAGKRRSAPTCCSARPAPCR